jgi:hypothetical protein
MKYNKCFSPGSVHGQVATPRPHKFACTNAKVGRVLSAFHYTVAQDKSIDKEENGTEQKGAVHFSRIGKRCGKRG